MDLNHARLPIPPLRQKGGLFHISMPKPGRLCKAGCIAQIPHGRPIPWKASLASSATNVAAGCWSPRFNLSSQPKGCTPADISNRPWTAQEKTAPVPIGTEAVGFSRFITIWPERPLVPIQHCVARIKLDRNDYPPPVSSLSGSPPARVIRRRYAFLSISSPTSFTWPSP